MTGKGIRLLKFRVTGDGKEDAIVEFKPGLNVIAHMSQSGKTYILEGINFLMGGKTKPRKIRESKGYNTLWLEFEDFKGSIFVLMRSVTGDEFRLYQASLCDLTLSTPFKKVGQTAQAKSSAAALLFDLSGFPKASLKSNRFNDKANLTFRTISHFFIVEELVMQETFSPVLSGTGFAVTAEKSAFKFLISGRDDSGLDEIEGPTPEQKAAAIKRSVLQALIDQLSAEVDKRLPEAKASEVETIEERLSQKAAEVEQTTSEIQRREIERREAWSSLHEQESRLIVLDELLSRFQLLQSHYQTDLKRLEFISEGEHLLDQLETAACPTCGARLSSHPPGDCSSGGAVENWQGQTAFTKEAEKIQLHLLDLGSTVKTLSHERDEVGRLAKSLRANIKIVEQELSQSLSPRLLLAKDEVQALMREQSLILYAQTLRDRLEGLKAERDSIGELPADGGNSPDTDSQVHVDEAMITEFCEVMRGLLERWHYLPANRHVEFDAAAFDFIVDGQGRADNGKGVRAIIHAAFNVALLRYCLEKELPHPRFVILDSPLTTYKGRSEDGRPEDSEEVRGEVQVAFFEDLARASKDEQIIVLENKPPPTSIVQSAHYIEFVGAGGTGRAGFFPIIQGV